MSFHHQAIPVIPHSVWTGLASHIGNILWSSPRSNSSTASLDAAHLPQLSSLFFQRPWGAGLHVLQQLRQPRPSAHQRGHCSWGNIYEYLRFFQFESSVSSCCTKPTAKESWVGATHTWHGLKSSQQTGRHSLQLRPPNKRLNLTLLRAHICSQSKSEDLNLIRHPLSHLWPARDHPQPRRHFCPMTRPAIEAAALPASQKQRRSIWGGLQVISMRRVWRYRGYQFFESISVQYAFENEPVNKKRIWIRIMNFIQYLLLKPSMTIEGIPSTPQQSTFVDSNLYEDAMGLFHRLGRWGPKAG